MSYISILGRAAALAAVAGLVAFGGAPAAELPEATKKILKELKVPESILSDIDQELAVPQAWIEGARKEGEFRIVDTHSDKVHAQMTAPFRARYPFIKIRNTRGSYQSRTTRVMIALQAGNYTTDIAMDYGGYYEQFHKAGMLHDLREIPNFTKVPEQARGKDGTWVAHRRQYWCVSYNTNKVKKADLPKTWDGFLDDPRWRNGMMAIGNRPQLWILMLWGHYGPDYAKRYMARLFNEVKPQLRKEGMNALVSLTIAGELPLAVPSSEYRVQLSQEKGAPVGYHCPEPVPASMAEMGIFKGNPHMNAARLYVNWLLSKEGQIAQFYASRSVPIHEGLQRKEFVPFAEEIQGKKIALRAPELMRDSSVEVQKIWGEHWAKATGEGPERTVSIKIEKIQKKGAVVDFKLAGKPETAAISGSRTRITVGGKKVRRNALKPGLECQITYRGSGTEATALACK
jgi:iron(III) transport system substrate-binding protein